MVNNTRAGKPIVFSCSGNCSAAQFANYLAIRLKERGIAGISGKAGVEAFNESMIREAGPGNSIVVIDGCKLACAKACLNTHGIDPTLHIDLQQWGIKKGKEFDPGKEEADPILAEIERLIADINCQPVQLPATLKKRKKYSSYMDASGPGLDTHVKEVMNKQQLEKFIAYPYRLYKGNPFYVPALKKDIRDTFNKKKNPAHEFCEVKYWLAYRGNKVVGRIAGIINHSFNECWDKKYMRFGYFDFEEDETIAKLLLKTVEIWAAERGLDAVHGPLGFTNFDHAGMLVRGFDQLGTFAAQYNHAYYPLAMEGAGYGKEVDWVEYKIKVPQTIPEKLGKISQIIQKRYGLHVLELRSTHEMISYGKAIFNLLNSAYAGLFGMVPLNNKQIDHNIRKYLSYIRPDLVSLVLDENNELAAFGITMPSLSKSLQRINGRLFPFGFLRLIQAIKKNELADLLLVAVRPDLQGKGVNALLMHQLTKAYIKAGIKYAESNPELEENAKVQAIWDHYEAVQHKRRRCYIRYLGQ